MNLSVMEYVSAAQVGLARFMTSELTSMNHASTYQRTWFLRLQEEIIGACGERAWCKHFNQHWDASVNTFHHAPDAAGVEVRATSLDRGSLIIRDNDADDRWFYLVTGEPPTMTIRGCILGRNAKRDEWVKNPGSHRPSWFVPQSALTMKVAS